MFLRAVIPRTFDCLAPWGVITTITSAGPIGFAIVCEWKFTGRLVFGNAYLFYEQKFIKISCIFRLRFRFLLIWTMYNIRKLWLTYATTAMLLALMKKSRTPTIIVWMILAKIWGHVRAIVCLKKIQSIHLNLRPL